jgi:hypothetical protein
LHGDFGSESPIAQEGVRALYEEILATENPKAQVFFNQWKILFGEVCGYDVENLSDKLKKLAEFYVVKGRPQPAPLLFAVHTYYAILIKLLAAEIVSFFNPLMPRQVEKLQGAETPTKLKRELEDLERGGIFHQMGITNFLEGDLFSWYLAVWSEPIQALARRMISKLDEYNPGTFSEEPAQSRDLLKKLYQQLFPKSVRHDLGEYYTPDWLAEHVLNELGYVGDPDKRLLDPACGSGTFLVMAINRIRRWYDENREKCAYDEGELLKKILANVIGFDLNPLAVMAARTNYLVAVKDLIRHVEGVEIPVYLCDSIMTPAEYGDLFTGSQGTLARVPCGAMKPPHLLVPKEIAKSPKEVAKYADVLETCVGNAYKTQEFLSRCRDEGLKITATEGHIGLYKELVKLDKANKNGIWARIIKNNFAPLFVGSVDYVAGNPPWINWESLPSEYRDSLKLLWEEYGLFTLSGSAARLGGGKKDLSMLFVYGCADNYVRNPGRLGFVITQSVFKSKGAGDGFRRLHFERGEEKLVLRPVVVHDLSDLLVFENAINRTAVLVCEKQSKDFAYPIRYVVWTGPSHVDQDETLAEVFAHTDRRTLEAVPVEPQKTNSPWLTLPKEALLGIRKIFGRNHYTAYTGAYTGGLNGCFWIRVIEKLGNGNLAVENLHDVGKIKVEHVKTVIEPDLVYELLRGRDVSRWHAQPSAHIILAQDPQTRRGVSEAEMKNKYPRTYSYLLKFKKQLLQRASSSVQRLMDGGAFYSMFAVGPYTLAEWKVVYKRLSNAMQAAFIPKDQIAHEKLILVTASSRLEAHYVAALLNSSPADLLLQGAAVRVQTKEFAPSDISHLKVLAFNQRETLHAELSSLSMECDEAAAKNDASRIAKLEAQIDRVAAKLWGITDDELKAIQDALAETGKSKRAAKEGDED